jgi:hypothetical protein
VPIPTHDAIVVNTRATEIVVPPDITSYWTFLLATDRVRVSPAGAMATQELRYGWMRLVRYERRPLT